MKRDRHDRVLRHLNILVRRRQNAEEIQTLAARRLAEPVHGVTAEIMIPIQIVDLSLYDRVGSRVAKQKDPHVPRIARRLIVAVLDYLPIIIDADAGAHVERISGPEFRPSRVAEANGGVNPRRECRSVDGDEPALLLCGGASNREQNSDEQNYPTHKNLLSIIRGRSIEAQRDAGGGLSVICRVSVSSRGSPRGVL